MDIIARDFDRAERTKEKSPLSFKMRRLYKEDKDRITRLYSCFDKIFYNPVKGDLADRIFIEGQFWGLWQGEKILARSYFLPSCRSAFRDTDACRECLDLIGDLSGRLVCGYIARRPEIKEDPDVYGAFFRAAKIYAGQTGRDEILWLTPAALFYPMERRFSAGLWLRGLRGADNAVANYIFYGSARLRTPPFDKTGEAGEEKASTEDSKTLSRLLEDGYVGFDCIGEKEILLRR